MTAHYEQHFRGSDLRATQFTILSHLAQTGPLPMNQLADLLGVERTTLTRNLSLLARKALVAQTDSVDARVHNIGITKRGEAAVDKAMPRWLAAEGSVRAVLKQLQLPRAPG